MSRINIHHANEYTCQTLVDPVIEPKDSTHNTIVIHSYKCPRSKWADKILFLESINGALGLSVGLIGSEIN